MFIIYYGNRQRKYYGSFFFDLDLLVVIEENGG